MHRPPSSRRRSYAPQLCAAVAFLLLLLLSLSILHIRLSSSSNHSSVSNSSHVIPYRTDDDEDDDRIDDLDLLSSDPKPLTPPSDDPTPNLFWDHSLSVARISFHRPVTTSPPHPHLIPPPHLSFASDDEPLDPSVKTQLSAIRHIEDALLIQNSPMRNSWANWLEKKRDFIKRDRMLRSVHHEMLNPRNHPLLQDPDVAGSTGLTRGDRMMQRAVLKEMDEADLSGEGRGMEGRRRRMLDLKGLGFSEFVDRFFEGGRCGIRVFMVWNSPEWSFGVRQRRGVESVLYHHGDACVLVFSETVERGFFKEFVDDGYCWSLLSQPVLSILHATLYHLFWVLDM